MYGDRNMETYITICKIDSQWEFAVCCRELKQGLCFNLEGWDGEGDGRELQQGADICTSVADSHWYLTENIRTGHGTTDYFPNRKRSTSRLYIVTLLI